MVDCDGSGGGLRALTGKERDLVWGGEGKRKSVSGRGKRGGEEGSRLTDRTGDLGVKGRK